MNGKILITLTLALCALAAPARAATLAELIEGAKKEGSFRGQWGQNSFGGSEGFQELLAGMNKKYKLNIKGQYTPGPDMQRLMLRVIQEAAAGQPASTDVYLGNAQAISALTDAIKNDPGKDVQGRRVAKMARVSIAAIKERKKST